MSVDTFEETQTVTIPDHACQGFISVAGATGYLSDWVEVTGFHVDSRTVAIYGDYRFPIKKADIALSLVWTCDDIDPTPLDTSSMNWPIQVLRGDTIVIKFGP